MLTRSVLALLLAAPLSLATVGCASNPFRPIARTSSQPAALSSSHTDRLLQLARRYEQQGNYEGALRLYRQAEKAEPGNSRLESNIAALTARQTQPADRSADRQLADVREGIHAGQGDRFARNSDEEYGDTPQSAPEFATASSEVETNSSPAEAPLPDIEPARDAEWMFAATDPATSQSQQADGVSGDEPVWWHATQTPASTNVAPEAGGWTPTAWTASADDAAPGLESALERLESHDATDRKDGLAELARLGPDATAAVPRVQSLTDDDDPLVQAHAAWALWSITQEGFEAIPALISLLKSDEENVVQVSAYMLGTIGPAAAGSVDALYAVCDASDLETRLYAAEALSRITPESAEAVRILTSALTSDDQQSRWLAAISLAGVAPSHREAAIAALTDALSDTDESVCSVAALTLGGFGPDARSAVPQLERAAASEIEDVRTAAQVALACITR